MLASRSPTREMLTTVGFNVDDVTRQDLLLLEAVIDGGVQLQLLGALHCLQANDNMSDDFAIASRLPQAQTLDTQTFGLLQLRNTEALTSSDSKDRSQCQAYHPGENARNASCKASRAA